MVDAGEALVPAIILDIDGSIGTGKYKGLITILCCKILTQRGP